MASEAGFRTKNSVRKEQWPQRLDLEQRTVVSEAGFRTKNSVQKEQWPQRLDLEQRTVCEKNSGLRGWI